MEKIIAPWDGDLKLKKLLLDIAYKNKLSHLGSYFSSIDIVDQIHYSMKSRPSKDIFILSSGHAALALYCVLQKYYNHDAEALFKKHGGHPHYDSKNSIHCSTGSLGMGLTVAVGRALANPSRTVHCLISDGECAEGSIWESLRFIQEHNVKNIKVYVNINGYTAYDAIEPEYLKKRLLAFLPSINIFYTNVNHFSFLRGINAHYHIMSQKDYDSAREEIQRRSAAKESKI
jgi:transketolase